MAETPSVMIPIGSTIPEFTLPDGHGHAWSLPKEHQGVLVIFMCNHCPYVIHIAESLPAVFEACQQVGLEMVGINANDVANYPDDSPERMVETAEKYGWKFPYLYDESQEVARSFQAACTPDIFLYDSNGQLYYRGQLDNTRPNEGSTANAHDVLHAIECMNSGTPSPEVQKPAVGCNIKWKT